MTQKLPIFLKNLASKRLLAMTANKAIFVPGDTQSFQARATNHFPFSMVEKKKQVICCSCASHHIEHKEDATWTQPSESRWIRSENRTPVPKNLRNQPQTSNKKQPPKRHQEFLRYFSRQNFDANFEEEREQEQTRKTCVKTWRGKQKQHSQLQKEKQFSIEIQQTLANLEEDEILLEPCRFSPLQLFSPIEVSTEPLALRELVSLAKRVLRLDQLQQNNQQPEKKLR